MKNNKQLQESKITTPILTTTQCELCSGFGLIKNDNLYCSTCDAYRCKFTFNMSSDEFYKYKFCEFCLHSNLEKPSSKIHCLKCCGEGYYINPGVICNTCEISHKVCNCIIKLFVECVECFGLGTKP